MANKAMAEMTAEELVEAANSMVDRYEEEMERQLQGKGDVNHDADLPAKQDDIDDDLEVRNPAAEVFDIDGKASCTINYDHKTGNVKYSKSFGDYLLGLVMRGYGPPMMQMIFRGNAKKLGYKYTIKEEEISAIINRRLEERWASRPSLGAYRELHLSRLEYIIGNSIEYPDRRGIAMQAIKEVSNILGLGYDPRMPDIPPPLALRDMPKAPYDFIDGVPEHTWPNIKLADRPASGMTVDVDAEDATSADGEA